MKRHGEICWCKEELERFGRLASCPHGRVICFSLLTMLLHIQSFISKCVSWQPMIQRHTHRLCNQYANVLTCAICWCFVCVSGPKLQIIMFLSLSILTHAWGTLYDYDWRQAWARAASQVMHTTIFTHPALVMGYTVSASIAGEVGTQKSILI